MGSGPLVTPAQRDHIAALFRRRLCTKLDVAPFRHQAEWWLATEGLVLGHDLDPDGCEISLADGQRARYHTATRLGGPARVVADLGAFKVGKSFGSALWAAGFAAVPQRRLSLIGLEYDLCAPEFEYLCEFLLSERGMNLPYTSLQNRPRDGRMYLDLPSGTRYDAKSWERKDSLKGKELDAYLFCEAFMLPGLEAYTGIKQNLDARQGFAVFATTPDRPWVQVFHDHGHGQHPDFAAWHCTCNVPRSVNRFTFSQSMQDLDDPTKGGLMTREKFAIAYLGRIGSYVGRVFNYQRGDRQFTRETHPQLWTDGPASFQTLRIPDGWKLEAAIDTGTYMAGLIVAINPEGEAFVIWEEPNYRYVASELELLPQTSIPDWARAYRAMMVRYRIRTAWRDPNSQFVQELRHYDLHTIGQTVTLEARTEIVRSYFQLNRVWFAPWLQVLPYELETAQWPETHTAAGKFMRLKKHDHLLDCLEHCLAHHPQGRHLVTPQGQTWASEQGYKIRSKVGNTHIGAH